MPRTRHELEIREGGVRCPRADRLVDVEICLRCPALRRRTRTAIVCTTPSPRLSAFDLSV